MKKVPRASQQNDVPRGIKRTLIESVRSMLSDLKLLKRFWPNLQGLTPYEAWADEKPNVRGWVTLLTSVVNNPMTVKKVFYRDRNRERLKAKVKVPHDLWK